MIHLPIRLIAAAVLALSVAAIGCSRDEPEPQPQPVPEKKVVFHPKPPTVAPRTSAAPIGAPVGAATDPFGNPHFVPTAPPETLAKHAMPPSGPASTDVEAWTTGQAAFKHYATMNGFSEEATQSFFLKHMADNGDHFRMMMFGVLPGGPRYIAIKVYKDGRVEVLPDEM